MLDRGENPPIKRLGNECTSASSSVAVPEEPERAVWSTQDEGFLIVSNDPNLASSPPVLARYLCDRIIPGVPDSTPIGGRRRIRPEEPDTSLSIAHSVEQPDLARHIGNS